MKYISIDDKIKIKTVVNTALFGVITTQFSIKNANFANFFLLFEFNKNNLFISSLTMKIYES